MTRLLPGTLGDPDSLVDESHNSSLLEYPQYKAFNFKDMKVPDILVTVTERLNRGEEESFERTFERRST